MQEWPETEADDPIAEAVKVSLGLILSFTPIESERRAAINTLVTAHRRAIAARETGQTWIN